MINKDEFNKTNKRRFNPFDSFSLNKDLQGNSSKINSNNENENDNKNYDVMLKITQSKQMLIQLIHETLGDSSKCTTNKQSNCYSKKISKFPLLFRTATLRSRNYPLKQSETLVIYNNRETERERERGIETKRTIPQTFLTLQSDNSYLSPLKASKHKSKNLKSVISYINGPTIKPQLNEDEIRINKRENVNLQTLNHESLSEPNIHSIKKRRKRDFLKKLNKECRFNLHEAETINRRIHKYSKSHCSQSKIVNNQLDALNGENKMITALMNEMIASKNFEHKRNKTIDKYAQLSDRGAYKYRKNYLDDANNIRTQNENHFIKAIKENSIHQKEKDNKQLVNLQKRKFIEKTINSIDSIMKKFKSEKEVMH